MTAGVVVFVIVFDHKQYKLCINYIVLVQKYYYLYFLIENIESDMCVLWKNVDFSVSLKKNTEKNFGDKQHD